MPETDLLDLRDRLLDHARAFGACAVGVCDQQGLACGPPSTDLTRELAGARSTIARAYPFDEAKLERYMGKIDHGGHQADYLECNCQSIMLSMEIADLLRDAGFDVKPINPGSNPGGGETRARRTTHSARPRSGTP